MFLVSTLNKIFDRSPFTCELIRYFAVLNPVVLVSCEQKSCQKRLKLLLNEFMKQNILLSSQCDAAVMDLTSLCSNKFKTFRVQFKESKEEIDQLDNFFFQNLTYRITKLLVLLSNWSILWGHGQTFVEKQFSVNNQVLDNNMQMMSIVAQKHIVNQVKANQLTSHSTDTNKDLLLSAKCASARYWKFIS